MKLLIIDDDVLTRKKLVSALPWKELGITTVLEAEDGRHGLECALKYRPDIILCDVYMPRMTGIDMAEQLQEQLPNTSLIFMSGYSNKSYLLAAIRLKAVRYVEKPLNMQEIRIAVKEARRRCLQNRQLSQHRTWVKTEQQTRLALLLTAPYSKYAEEIRHLCATLSLKRGEQAIFTAYLVQFSDTDTLTEDTLGNFPHHLGQFLEARRLSFLLTTRRQNYLILHVWSYGKSHAPYLREISEFLLDWFSVCSSCHFSRGSSVTGIANAYFSYQEAVFLMQSCYFFDPGTVLSRPTVHCSRNARSKISLPPRFLANFQSALEKRDMENIHHLLELLHSFFYQNTSALAEQTRDLYYKLFLSLETAVSQEKLPETEDTILDQNTETTLSLVEGFSFFQQLHQALIDRVEHFFTAAQNQQENSTISLIKTYIWEHFSDPDFSVKDISRHVYLSVPYLCTLFKSMTGKTLNQYITEYRIEQAKQLLQDPRNRVVDISARVGYNDGSYFGKSFKKVVGLSPLEYRDSILL